MIDFSVNFADSKEILTEISDVLGMIEKNVKKIYPQNTWIFPLLDKHKHKPRKMAFSKKKY